MRGTQQELNLALRPTFRSGVLEVGMRRVMVTSCFPFSLRACDAGNARAAMEDL